MKYLKALLCAVLICLLLSGCSFRISSSIDDLISPLSPFGDNADIKGALDAYAQNGYTLKSAGSGTFITSYNFYDLDGDGSDEAIAFYEPADNIGTIDMAVIKKTPEKWVVVENIQGAGKEINSLAFEDVNGDGLSEIIVCWDVIANSSNHELCVYRFNAESEEDKLLMIDESKSVNSYIAVDLYGDETKELLLFEISTANSQSNKAELYSAENNKLRLLGETKLDSHVSSYDNLKIESAEDSTRIYADGMGTDGSSMLTEIIYWSRAYKTIISPFYSYSTGLSEGTKRSSTLPSLDVNQDDLIEIPIDYEVSSNPDEISKYDWQIYKHSVLMHAAYSLYSPRDGYIVLIPDEDIDIITAAYDEKRHEMTVTNSETDKTVFSVMPVLKATYSEEKYPDYTSVLEASGYCYLVKEGTDEQISITADDLSNYIKTVE